MENTGRSPPAAKMDAVIHAMCYWPMSIDSTDRGLHSTQKPVHLLEYFIKTYTSEGDTVLDNCMGSGSTGVACLNTGREFIGIELDAGYFETAKRRISNILNKNEKT